MSSSRTDIWRITQRIIPSAYSKIEKLLLYRINPRPRSQNNTAHGYGHPEPLSVHYTVTVHRNPRWLPRPIPHALRLGIFPAGPSYMSSCPHMSDTDSPRALSTNDPMPVSTSTPRTRLGVFCFHGLARTPRDPRVAIPGVGSCIGSRCPNPAVCKRTSTRG